MDYLESTGRFPADICLHDKCYLSNGFLSNLIIILMVFFTPTIITAIIIQYFAKDQAEQTIDEDSYTAVVKYKIKVQPVDDGQETQETDTANTSQSPSVTSMPSLAKLFTEPKAVATNSEDQPSLLKAKDSAIIHIQKQLRKSPNSYVRHLMQINFKLPPKQQAMIMEMSSLRPIKEVRNLYEEDNNSRLVLAKESSCTCSSSESKSVRFNEKSAAANRMHSGEVKLKTALNSVPNSAAKQRVTELHALRLAVEQKRLELLELKIEREREALKREKTIVHLENNEFCDL